MAQDPTGSGYQVVVTEQESEDVDPESLKKHEVYLFLELAQERFRTIMDAESILRGKMLEDLRFRASEQWPDHIRSSREQDNRPCLTVNRIPQFIRQVTNSQRASKPSVRSYRALCAISR